MYLHWSRFPLLQELALTLFLVGVFRVTEVGADIVLRLVGSSQPGLAPLAGAVATATVAALLVVALWRTRRAKNWSYSYLQGEGDELSPEQREQLEAMAPLDILDEEGLALKRVLPLGRTIDAGGVLVELIAIEVRQRITRVILTTRDREASARERQMLSGPAPAKMPDPDDLPLPSAFGHDLPGDHRQAVPLSYRLYLRRA